MYDTDFRDIPTSLGAEVSSGRYSYTKFILVPKRAYYAFVSGLWMQLLGACTRRERTTGLVFEALRLKFWGWGLGDMHHKSPGIGRHYAFFTLATLRSV